MSALPTPRALIFDWDNTLVDTWPIIHAALNATFTEYGLAPWTLEQVQTRVRRSMRDSFPELFGERWEEAGNAYRGHYRALHLGELNPLPGAQTLIRAVKEAGLYSVVVSNKLGPSLRQEAAHLGWEPWFDALVGSNDAAHDKPHPAPVRLALSGSGITPDRDVWFIGDSEIDLECALATGCTGILYGRIAGGHAQFTSTHYHGFAYAAHAHALDDIKRWLGHVQA